MSHQADDRELQEWLRTTPLAHEPFFLAARLSAEGSAAINHALEPLGMKARHYSVLTLACSDESHTQRELSQSLGLDPSQIVGLIDELEALHAVERRPDPRDRRSKIIVATDEGERLLGEAQQLVDQQTSTVLQGLSSEERLLFLKLLHSAAMA